MLERLDIAAHLERELSALPGDLHDLLDDVFITRIDPVRRAELLTQLQPCRVGVHADNRLATDHLRRHHRRHPYAAEPGYDQGVTWSRAHHVDHRPGAGLDPTAERRQDRERNVA
jgi:hypothetical protein